MRTILSIVFALFVWPVCAEEWVFAPAGTYGPLSMHMAAVDSVGGTLGIACHGNHVIVMHMHPSGLWSLVGQDVELHLGIDGLRGELLEFPATIDIWAASTIARAQISPQQAEALANGRDRVRAWVIAGGKFRRIADFSLSNAKAAISDALTACAAQ